MSASDPRETLRTVFADLADIPESEWQRFSAQVREYRFAPRQHLMREGHPAPTVHFIVSGFVFLYMEAGRAPVADHLLPGSALSQPRRTRARSRL